MNRAPSPMGVCIPILAVVTCCSSSGGPAAEQSQSLELPEATQLGPCGGADLGEPEERYRSCLRDDDCIAVPVVGCCQNGWKASVNRELEDEYEGSFQCPTERPICPLYLVKDMRVPACDQVTHVCEMVPASDFTCDFACDGTTPDHCDPASGR